VFAGNDITINLGESTQLSGTPSGSGFTYSWSPITGLSCTGCLSPLATPESTTTYNFEVTDSLGCTAVDMITVSVDEIKSIYIPDIFSPNGDGENDMFFVQGKGIEYVDLKIYDRWGEKVFERTKFNANDKDLGWGGSYKGKPLNPAVFVYVVTGMYRDGEEILEAGNFTLIK